MSYLSQCLTRLSYWYVASWSMFYPHVIWTVTPRDGILWAQKLRSFLHVLPAARKSLFRIFAFWLIQLPIFPILAKGKVTCKITREILTIDLVTCVSPSFYLRGWLDIKYQESISRGVTCKSCIDVIIPVYCIVTVCGSLLAARLGGGGRFSDSTPACASFFCLSGNQLVRANSTLYARIDPQWLSELRRMWPSVPCRNCV